MNALVLTYGGLIAARIVNAWLSTGNSVSAIWVGSKKLRKIFKDRALGLAAPSWSMSALVRHHGILVQRHPMLSAWKEADAAIDRLDADVLITAMTLEIIPPAFLSRFHGRAVNFHPALLPQYRGPSPRVGMILDDKASLYGGMTLHCLSPKIDKGDIIGARKVAYDPKLGFAHWDVCIARAAGDLVERELLSYLRGELVPSPQPIGAGNYRKVDKAEITLSAEHSAERTKWLCDRLGDLGRVRLENKNAAAKPYRVSRFVRTLGPPTSDVPRIGMFTIDFDSADARVRVTRHLRWAQVLRYLSLVRSRVGHL